uniref:hypothetical protein n=1 Tax=Streptomyces tubercidicus TaxID=47759 RepID=UPI0030E41417|nr:hypothetical protein OG690_38390 [Streptomyces tubercidicus]
MSLRPSTDRAIVYCERCPDHPVLPTHFEDADTRRCIRCQGQHRWLPEPHPADHLCKPCQRECPNCQATTPRGGRCRACQGLCRTCDTPLPARPEYADGISHVAPEKRKDHHRKWEQTFFPRSWDLDQCDACQHAADAVDPVRAVLACLPNKLLRACGGGVSASVIHTIQDELTYQLVPRLTARVERRWWTTWANRPLERPAQAGQDGYTPDDVALWLLTPTPCDGRCEDGWHPASPDQPSADDRPCSVCNGGWLLPGRHPERNDPDDYPDTVDGEATPLTAADRTPTEAIAYRPPVQECDGRGGTCGVPVTAPYTQCPACLDWPWCNCRRRYDPNQGERCRTCSAG